MMNNDRQSNAEPTTYQRRYLIYCEAEGREPGTFPAREYARWALPKVADFKKKIGISPMTSLTAAQHREFDEYLRSFVDRKGEESKGDQ